MGIFNRTIIPLALVGYEMIIAKSYPVHTRGIIILSHVTGLHAVEFGNNWMIQNSEDSAIC